MRFNAKHLAMLLGSLTVVTLAGCGGGSSAPATETVSGVVADGYLKGATVFIDKNGNKIWDDGEAKTTTGAGGKYNLVLAKNSMDAINFPVVVQVTTSTINEDDGQAVVKEYILTAPAGKPEVITPITTMIQNKIETGMNEAAAVAAIQANLGVTVDPYKDFVAESKSATSTLADKNAYIKIYNAAQVVATKIAENLAIIKASPDAGTNLNVMLSAAVEKVSSQLPQISELPEVKATTVMAPTAAAASSTSIVVFVIDDVKSAITAQASALVPVPVSSSFKDDVTNGMYWLSSYEYGVVQLAPDGISLVETNKYWDYATRSWTDTRPADWSNYTEYVLASSGWKATTDSAADGTVTFNSDGSATWTNKFDGSAMIVSQVAFDVSGKPLYPGLPSVVFPAGSKMFKMTQKRLSDSYELWSSIYKNQAGTQQESNRLGYFNGTEYVHVNKLSELTTVFEDKLNGNKFYFDELWDENTGSSVMGTFSGTNTVNFYVGEAKVGSSTWEDKLVNGQTLRIVNVPASINAAYYGQNLPFFVEKDGYVMQGEYIKAGAIHIDEDNYNKTAFDALLNNAFTTPAKRTAKTMSKHFLGI